MKKNKKNKTILTQIKKKIANWDKLFKYEEKYLWDKLVKKADYIFSKYIRKRDERKDCITSDLDTCSHKIEQACHRIPRAYYSHRWNEANCSWWCVSCNSYHPQSHWMSFERYQINKYWMEWVEEQHREKNKKKPTIEELNEIIEKFWKLYEELLNK